MAEHNEQGNKAEIIAADYLSEKKFKIREKNWKFGQKEIDIIAEYQNKLIIVEVKARAESNAEPAGDLLSKKKMRNLVDAAEAYIFKEDLMLETRFDMIYIVFGPQEYKIQHIEEVFMPGVNW